MEAIHFLQQFRAVFQNSHFIVPVALYMTDDKFDNFPFIADKIRVKSRDKGFVVHSTDEAINDACMVFCGALKCKRVQQILKSTFGHFSK